MLKKTNLELKHFCSNFKDIRRVLREIGAKKASTINQKDYFFNLPHKEGIVLPRLKLRIEEKTQTLVYYERPDFQGNKSITAKINLYSVNDNQLLPYLKEVLGVKAIVEKKREKWSKGNTVFNLDEVKGVGNIFEIELQKKGNITKKDKAIFKSYQNKLKPYLGTVIKGSNVDLVQSK